MSAVVVTAVTSPYGVQILEHDGKFHINLAPHASYVCTPEEALEMYRRLEDALVNSGVFTGGWL